MSGYRFERYKNAREEDENQLAARCARYWSHQDISQPPTGSSANASSGCPCDPAWAENPNQPTGCEYLSYEQLPHKPLPRGRYAREIDFGLAVMGLLFFVCFIFIYRKFRRDERARVLEEQLDLEIRARVEDAKRRAQHSGRAFVAVRQPTGELELAEVVVVVERAAVERAANREGEAEREEERARTARRDGSDEDATEVRAE